MRLIGPMESSWTDGRRDAVGEAPSALARCVHAEVCHRARLKRIRVLGLRLSFRIQHFERRDRCNVVR
jgi:hypothetical protein